MTMIMRVLLSIFCCQFLAMGIAKAQSQPQIQLQSMSCIDPRHLTYHWKIAGREGLHAVLGEDTKIGMINDGHNVSLQVNHFIASNGDLICQYYSSNPLIVLNMGKPTMKKPEDTNRKEGAQKREFPQK